MKINQLQLDGRNTGKLKAVPSKTKSINIYKGRYIEKDTSHPLYNEDVKYYKRIYCLEYQSKYVYWFYHFGKDEGQGTHVGMNWFQHQRFLWMQKRHWLQKEGNLRYLVNLIFLSLGAYISLKSIG